MMRYTYAHVYSLHHRGYNGERTRLNRDPVVLTKKKKPRIRKRIGFMYTLRVSLVMSYELSEVVCVYACYITSLGRTKYVDTKKKQNRIATRYVLFSGVYIY